MDEAVAAIEPGRWSFHVEIGGRELPVIVAVSRYRGKYLKGAGNALQPEALLALPEGARSQTTSMRSPVLLLRPLRL